MKKDFTLNQNDFDDLLGWLAADRDEAGVLYEKIRQGLIKFFKFRGCADSHTLADETINRVAAKISTFDSSKNVKTITYFYGFAANVFLEYTRSEQNREFSLESDDILSRSLISPHDSDDAEYRCFEECLAKLTADERKLVIDYYGKEKLEKFEERRKMAAALNLKMPALHTKVFRLRSVLRDCLEKCRAEK